MSSFLQLCAHALVSVKATINIALVNNPNHMTQNKTNIHHLRETHLGSFTYSSSSSCVRGRCSTLSPIMMTTWFRHLLKLDQDVWIRGKRSLASLLHYKLFYFIEESFSSPMAINPLFKGQKNENVFVMWVLKWLQVLVSMLFNVI